MKKVQLTDQEGRWSATLFALVLVALGAALTWLIYPPLADFVEWEYQAFIASKLVVGEQVGGYYLRPYPVPYLTSQVLMAGFNFIASPQQAGRLTLLVYLAMAGVLAVYFVRANGLNPVLAYPLLLACIICNSSFWSGYLNYQFGLLVLMAYLSLSPRQQASPWINGLFALLAFACHGFCFVAFGVLVGLMALARGPRAVLTLAVATLPALLLTAWYMAVHNNDVMPPIEAPVPYASPKFIAYKLYTLSKAGPYQNFMLGGQADVGRAPIYYWLGVAANGIVALTLMALIWRAVRAVRQPAQRGLAWAALVLTLLYLLAPSVALQVVNPGERLLYPLLLVVFAIGLKRGARHPWPRPVSGAVAAISFAFVLGSLSSLLWATHTQGYESVNKEQFTEANQSPVTVLYWHRPYQFKLRFDHMVESHRQGKLPSLRIIFPTSFLGEHPAQP